MISSSCKEKGRYFLAHLLFLCLRIVIVVTEDIYKNGKNLILNNLELQWPLGTMFQLDKIIYLKCALGSEGSQIKETE